MWLGEVLGFSVIAGHIREDAGVLARWTVGASNATGAATGIPVDIA